MPCSSQRGVPSRRRRWWQGGGRIGWRRTRRRSRPRQKRCWSGSMLWRQTRRKQNCSPPGKRPLLVCPVSRHWPRQCMARSDCPRERWGDHASERAVRDRHCRRWWQCVRRVSVTAVVALVVALSAQQHIYMDIMCFLHHKCQYRFSLIHQAPGGVFQATHQYPSLKTCVRRGSPWAPRAGWGSGYVAGRLRCSPGSILSFCPPALHPTIAGGTWHGEPSLQIVTSAQLCQI